MSNIVDPLYRYNFITGFNLKTTFKR